MTKQSNVGIKHLSRFMDKTNHLDHKDVIYQLLCAAVFKAMPKEKTWEDLYELVEGMLDDIIVGNIEVSEKQKAEGACVPIGFRNAKDAEAMKSAVLTKKELN